MSHKNYALAAEVRERAGKGVARALRRENKTPAVIYGDKKEPVKIALGSKEINLEYNKGQMFTTLCDLNIGKDRHLVLARDVQLHPVTDVVEHVDFLRVTKNTKIAVDVPVRFINEDKSPGIDAKGILNIVRHTVELVCSAVDIPEEIEVNLEGKENGDSVNISDAQLPQGAKPIIDNRDFTIATLLAPKTIEQEEAEDAAAAEETKMAIDEEEVAEGEEETADNKE